MSWPDWEHRELTISDSWSSSDDDDDEEEEEEDGDIDNDSRPRHFNMAWTVLWKAEHGELRRE